MGDRLRCTRPPSSGSVRSKCRVGIGGSVAPATPERRLGIQQGCSGGLRQHGMGSFGALIRPGAQGCYRYRARSGIFVFASTRSQRRILHLFRVGWHRNLHQSSRTYICSRLAACPRLRDRDSRCKPCLPPHTSRRVSRSPGQCSTLRRIAGRPGSGGRTGGKGMPTAHINA